jgi:hypothetical protein
MAGDLADLTTEQRADYYHAVCRSLEIHQAFTSYNNPKGNADTERFMRTLKEECLGLRGLCTIRSGCTTRGQAAQ